jgi:hypothetical protein
MFNIRSLTFLFLAFFLIAIPTTVFAKQCIKNSSGAVLDITWHNQQGKVDNNASNHSLSFGFEACQNNTNLGFAVVRCSGCIFAELSAQAAVTVGGAGAFGVCVAATGGGCTLAGGLFAAATEAAIAQIPPAFGGKKIIVPDKGKTVVVNGNAFGLEIAHPSQTTATIVCPTGTLASAKGDCSIIAPGYYSNDGVNPILCPAGSQCYAGGTNAPFQCGVGTYSKAGASSCTECPRNTMQDKPGQDGCGGCSTGYGGSNYRGQYVAGKYVGSGAAACLYQCNQNQKTHDICYN